MRQCLGVGASAFTRFDVVDDTRVLGLGGHEFHVSDTRLHCAGPVIQGQIAATVCVFTDLGVRRPEPPAADVAREPTFATQCPHYLEVRYPQALALRILTEDIDQSAAYNQNIGGEMSCELVELVLAGAQGPAGSVLNNVVAVLMRIANFGVANPMGASVEVLLNGDATCVGGECLGDELVAGMIGAVSDGADLGDRCSHDGSSRDRLWGQA